MILKRLRENKGMTQEALGKLVGQSKSTISKYENGQVEPSNDTLRKFSNIFHVSVDYLLTGKKTDSDSNPITFDDFTYAMYNESGELKEVLEKIVYIKDKNGQFHGVSAADFQVTLYPRLHDADEK